MPMTLGDFFQSAPHSRPVNPRPVTFTVVAKGSILPGGKANPHGRPVSATVTAALVFLGGDGAGRARIEARAALSKRYPDSLVDEADLHLETVYHEVWQMLHEWDEGAQKVGKRFFESADLAREMLEPSELMRVYRIYNLYVSEEHPEVIGTANFRDAKG